MTHPSAHWDIPRTLESKCTDYNATSAWRVAPFIDINDSERTERLCTCWFGSNPMGAAMVCKQPGKSCADVWKQQGATMGAVEGMRCISG